MSMPGKDTPGVDAQNPWPGLLPFTEDLSAYFHGRSAEIEDLFRLIKRELLTVLFGQSGLGKTSLLQAGLFPELRAADFWPIYLRIDHSPDAPALAQQVRAAMQDALGAQGIDGPLPAGRETLWEFFHRKDVDFWNAKNRLVAPVLVFDQFEELFTLGRGSESQQARGRAWVAELADLVENRPPSSLRERLDRGSPDDAARYDFSSTSCKVVISLREDYLPEFEGLRSLMRSIMQNRMRVTRMTGGAALEAVELPGANLLEPGTGAAIVRFVAASTAQADGDGAPLADLTELEVEPSLLSLVCRELNNKRLETQLAKITTTLLEGNRQEILADYYERSVQDVSPETRRFIEDRLLTKSGYRDSVAQETALAAGVAAAHLDALIGRRLLRLEERRGAHRVELTHDVLAEPVRASRDRRQQREALAKAMAGKEAARQQLLIARRRIGVGIVASVILVVALSGMTLHWRRLSLDAEAGLEAAKAQRLKAEESRYAADMRLAQQALDDGNVGRALALLERYQSPPPGETDLRGFEWRHLRQLCEGESLSTFHGHTDQVRAVAFSRDGRLLVTGGADATVHVLDVVKQEEIAHWKVDGPGVTSLVFSPDGRTLACATGNWKKAAAPGTVYLWDFDSKNPAGIATARHGAPPLAEHAKSVNTVAFSPDGKLLATGSEDDRVMVWKLGPDGNQLVATLTGHSIGVNAVAFSPDSRWLAAGSGDGSLQIWDAQTLDPKFDGVVQVSGIMSLAYSPDGATLLVGSRDGPILFWDVEQNRQMADPLDSEQGLVVSIAFSPDGKQFATGGSNCTIELWRFADRRRLARLRGHRDMVFAAAFSPVGMLLASGSADQTVKFWDSDGQPEVPTLEQDAAVSSLAFSPDGKTLATAEGTSTSQAVDRRSEVHLWNVATRERLFSLPGHAESIHSLAYSPDGNMLASGSKDHAAILWDVAKRREIATLSGHTAAVLATRFSPDGTILATASQDQTIKLWNVSNPGQEPLDTLRGHEGGIRAVAFSRDGKLLASASADRTIRIWDVATRKPLAVLPGYQGACNAVEFSPDGAILATSSNDRTVRLWDVAAAKYQPGDEVILHGYNAAINALAFSPNGKTLAAGSQDSAVVLWNVRTNEEVAVFTPHRGGVLCVAFSPQGDLFATGSNDQTVKLWYATGPRDPAPADGPRSLWSRP